MVKISVIVPVYNCEDYIGESISSLLNQTFKDIEIICMDDGSSDNSLNILNKIAANDSRLKVFSQENQGASVARNNALKKATGDYVYFFDADDYIVEDALEKVYKKAVSTDSEIVIFYFDSYKDDIFYKHSKINLEKIFPDLDYTDFTFDCHDYRLLAFKGPMAPWFKLYKREFLEKYAYFEFPVNLRHNDIPFHVKTILKASKISFIPEYLYHYRLDNPNSISNTRLKSYKDIFCIIQIVEDFLKSEDLMDDFKKEFDYLKADQIIYQIRGRSNEYFDLAKEELSNVELNNDYLTENHLFKANSILNSNSIEEYNSKVEIYKLEKQIKKLSKSYKKLKAQNKELKNKKNKLEKQNNEILNSKSWKLTKIFRKSKNIIK